MTRPDPDEDAGWSSRTGFLLATVGSAVGIGSIWKFPYEVGANGGGAFVFVYGLGLVLVVVPLMLAEFAIGRRGRHDAATSLERVALSENRSGRWGFVGLLGAVTAFLILSFYSVIGGWTLVYALETAIIGLPANTRAATTLRFDDLLASPLTIAVAQAAFLGLVAAIVLRGVQKGIEAAMKVLMPVLGVLLVVLAGYSMVTGAARETLRFLFVPSFGALTGRGVLDALGLGFFSIGVGLGLLITFASYSSTDVDLKSIAIASVAADTLISLVAGLAVFPIVFANGLDPAAGPGLVFVSLPLAFSAMPAGRVAATAFFVLVLVAALGSAVSMLEGVVAVVDRRLGWSRRRTATVSTISCFVAGLASVLSFNRWSEVHPLSFVDRYRGATIYDLIDEATSNLLLPLGGFSLAVFAGWRLSDRLLATELNLAGPALVGLRLMLRFVAPATILTAALVYLIG